VDELDGLTDFSDLDALRKDVRASVFFFACFHTSWCAQSHSGRADTPTKGTAISPRANGGVSNDEDAGSTATSANDAATAGGGDSKPDDEAGDVQWNTPKWSAPGGKVRLCVVR
jgi:hypothetical protein